MAVRQAHLGAQVCKEGVRLRQGGHEGDHIVGLGAAAPAREEERRAPIGPAEASAKGSP
jgi:hypothetical protein